MAEKATSQAQQNANPFARLVDDGVARLGSVMAEVSKQEQKGFERVTELVDETARLTRESLLYGARLHAEWRRLALESLQWASAFTGRAG